MFVTVELNNGDKINISEVKSIKRVTVDSYKYPLKRKIGIFDAGTAGEYSTCRIGIQFIKRNGQKFTYKIHEILNFTIGKEVM